MSEQSGWQDDASALARQAADRIVGHVLRVPTVRLPLRISPG